MRTLFLLSVLLFSFGILQAKEYHVSLNGKDVNDGTITSPLKTINRAALLALPGDTVTVHEGTYREWVNPLYGGESEKKRILYRAAEGEKVIIKGSEIVDKWKKVKGNVWEAEVPEYNSLIEVLHGDWLNNNKNIHLADLFLDDESMYEVDSLEKVIKSDTIKSYRDPDGSVLLWFYKDGHIYANFAGQDPNKHITEVSVRPSCFYPTREGLNYITVRGFIFEQAASRWGAPTGEQIGMVGPNWAKCWIIENNLVKNSKCIGISLGKEAASGNNTNTTRVDGTHYYIEIIFNTLRKGWRKGNIGSHIVRNNEICCCEQDGIGGSMCGSFSEIYNNHIHDIWTKRQLSGSEMAGIKLHAAVDAYIHNNRIHRAWRGLWIDWMGQGIRISSNLLYDNTEQDLYYELIQGPYIVDNNIMLSPTAIQDKTACGAFVHNIIKGRIWQHNLDNRNTPYLIEHSTDIKGYCSLVNGAHRFYNNIFVDDTVSVAYKKALWPIFEKDNLQWKGAKISIETSGDSVFLTIGTEVPATGNSFDLGKATIPDYEYENADGTLYKATEDYFGNKRSEKNPVIGPFEISEPIKRIRVY